MKKILLIFFLLQAIPSFAQKITYTGFILVDSLPEELLPPGVSELGFVTAGDNNQPVGFGYDLGNGQYKIISKFGKEYDDFNGTDCKSYFRNDTLFFWSHVKYKSVQTFNYYSWDSKKLSFMDTYSFDASKIAQQNGEAALRKKNVKEAAQFYNQVEYAPVATLAKIAYSLLSVGHYLAKEAYLANSYQEAVEYMDGAFLYHVNKSLLDASDEYAYNKIVMNTFDQKQTDSLGPWITHYAQFLYKADSLERSEKMAEFVNRCYPKLAEAYLVRGDALYDMQREEDAKPVYDRYIALMLSRGDEAYIEQRAKERYK